MKSSLIGVAGITLNSPSDIFVPICLKEQMKNKDLVFSEKADKEFIAACYEKIESRFFIHELSEEDISHLCNAKRNVQEPVYSWYNLKEAFSNELPIWVINWLKQKYNFIPKHVLDPYCGGGTTILSLKRLDIKCTGVEYNPFIQWVARTKSKWNYYSISEIEDVVKKIKFDFDNRIVIPSLSTLHNKKYFSSYSLKQFLNVLNQVESLKVSENTKDFLKIGLASIIEQIGSLRKDGRALRYIPKIERTRIELLVRNAWVKQISHLKIIKKEWYSSNECAVLKGSAIDLNSLTSEDAKTVSIPSESIDLVLYSPPYLNNFDYSEIYKLELWLLGFLKSYEQWKNLREGTIRSHHSIKFKETNHLGNDSFAVDIYKLIDRMSNSKLLTNKRRQLMKNVIKGYFDDMFISLLEQYRVLKPGGFLVYNVANSKHGKLNIQTDLIIGEIATIVGFRPLDLIPLLNRNGRTSKKSFLRESIVVLRKPN